MEENKEGTLVCEECGSDKVQGTFWTEYNTHKVIDGCNSQGENDQDNWCPNCNEHCSITSQAIFENRDEEEQELKPLSLNIETLQ